MDELGLLKAKYKLVRLKLENIIKLKQIDVSPNKAISKLLEEKDQTEKIKEIVKEAVIEAIAKVRYE